MQINPRRATLLTGLLIGLSFPPLPFPFLLWVAWVPLLLAVEQAAAWPGYTGSLWQRSKRYWRMLGYLYPGFLVLNLVGGYWLMLTGWGGLKDPLESVLAAVAGSLASLVNALFMSLPVLTYLFIRRRLARGLAWAAFIALWLSFEYGHLRWDLSWSWFNLGNAFAWWPSYIQYYEWTGVLGGSFFVLLSNVLVLRLWLLLREEQTPLAEPTQGLLPRVRRWLRRIFGPGTPHRLALGIVGLWVLPWLVAPAFLDSGRAVYQPSGYINVRVVQPNIDPYADDREGVNDLQRVQQLVALMASQPLDSVDLVVMPETTLPGVIEESYVPIVWHFEPLRELMRKHPRLSILSGMVSYKVYPRGMGKTVTARQWGNDHVDVYNAAVCLPDSVIYHKGMLVPLTERMPFAEFLHDVLGDLHIDLGGGLGSYGLPDSVFPLRTRNGVKVGTMICYESVFGDFSREMVARGAQVGAIVTNDAWWSQTSGYIQHAAYASLRAIEYRRAIARSSNTGISQFVDAQGYPHQQLGWGRQGILDRRLPLYTHQTLFVRWGDWPGRLALLPALVFLGFALVQPRRRVRNVEENPA